MKKSYTDIKEVGYAESIEDSAVKVSKSNKKANERSLIFTISQAAKEITEEPEQEFAKIKYISNRVYYVKIKDISGGERSEDPIGTIYGNNGNKENKEETYSITYNLDGGQNLTEAITKYVQGTVVELPIPTKEGYAFEGWYLDKDFKSDKLLRINEEMSGDITLYAGVQATLPFRALCGHCQGSCSGEPAVGEVFEPYAYRSNLSAGTF